MRWAKGLKIYIIYGRKGAGKSLYMARIFNFLLKDFYKMEKKYPELKRRKIASNMKFNYEIEKKELVKFPTKEEFLYGKPDDITDKDYLKIWKEKYKGLKQNKDGHLVYWDSPKQLYSLRDTDIIWDEIGKDLPATGYASTPKKLRQVFSHLRKRGNRIFANTQIYEDIDVSFRRQIDRAFKLEKVTGSGDITATRPKPKMIWGLIKIKEFDPLFLEHEKDEFARIKKDINLLPTGWFFIRRKDVELYDTQTEIPPYRPNELEHIAYYCNEPNCKKTHIEHKKA